MVLHAEPSRIKRELVEPFTASSMAAMHITLATQAAFDDKPNEDWAGYRGPAAVLVDGAGIDKELRAGCSHSVAWYSQTIGNALLAQLQQPAVSLREALAAAIDEVAAGHAGTCNLAAGSPSSTVVAVRIVGSRLEYLVLCDSTLLLVHAGHTEVLTDSRLDAIAAPHRSAAAERVRAGKITEPALVRAERAAYVRAIEGLRNRPGGFWVCQSDATAADEAIVGSVDLAELELIVLASDGAMRLVDLFAKMTVEEFVAQVASAEGHALLARVRSTEAASRAWTAAYMAKAHDDATLLIIDPTKARADSTVVRFH